MDTLQVLCVALHSGKLVALSSKDNPCTAISTAHGEPEGGSGANCSNQSHSICPARKAISTSPSPLSVFCQSTACRYMFGLFCGLAPMSLTCSWLADTLSFPGRAADTYSAGCIPSSDNSHAKDAGDYSSPLNVQAAGKKSLAITKSAVAEQSPTVQAPLATKTPSDACKSGGIEAPYPAGAVLGC